MDYMGKILVTGALGYIGSHAVIELINAGYQVVCIDNLCNSSILVHDRLEELTRCKIPFHILDILDSDGLDKVFEYYEFDAVMHFAGLKSVSESCENPLLYYQNNVVGSLTLLSVAKKFGINNFIFSSSATVYGQSTIVPIPETASLSSTNPYGSTKQMVEQILVDLSSDPNGSPSNFNTAILRYFNPVGAHDSGRIGEDPRGKPNNLMPFISQVAIGIRPRLIVFGNDYDTLDGTGVRDFIHVVDLAIGHVKALDRLMRIGESFTVNLGTGKGLSVLQLIRSFESVSGRPIPFVFDNRRPGDVAVSYADVSKAKSILGWEARRDVMQMCKSTWDWQRNNPNGYE